MLPVHPILRFGRFVLFTSIATLPVVSFLTSTALWGAPAAKEEASITFSMSTSGELIAQYVVPARCGEIRFLDNRPLVEDKFRSQWSLAEPGRQEQRPRRSLVRKYIIKPQVVNMDRIYPPVLPVAPGSVLIYPRYFALAGKCGGGMARFSPPKGGIAVHGRAGSRPRVLQFSLSDEDNRSSFVYFGSQRPSRIAGANVVEGADFPPAASAFIREVVGSIAQSPIARSPRDPMRPPLIVATWAHGEGPIGMHGDVAGGIMRLTFTGDASKNLSESERRLISGSIAHEFAHLAQPPMLAKLPHFEVLAEGEAEVIRWLTLLRLGSASETDFWGWAETVVNQCNVLIDGGGWYDIRAKNYGKFPYVCGAAAIVLSALDQRLGDSLEDGLRLRRERLGKIGNSCVERYFDPANQRACAAPASGSFLAGDMPYQDWVAHVLGSPGTPLTDASDIPQDMKSAYTETVFTRILEIDCGTRSGYSHYPDRFVLDAGLKCKSMPDSFALSTVDGINLLEKPWLAAQAASRSCASEGSIRLGGPRGESTAVSCTSFSARQISLYRLASKTLPLGVTAER
jgi:hypothetical protein